LSHTVTPAQAGVQKRWKRLVPAFAGMANRGSPIKVRAAYVNLLDASRGKKMSPWTFQAGGG